VGTVASGAVGGKRMQRADLVIVESTFAEPGAPEQARQRVMLPLVAGDGG